MYPKWAWTHYNAGVRLECNCIVSFCVFSPQTKNKSFKTQLLLQEKKILGKYSTFFLGGGRGGVKVGVRVGWKGSLSLVKLINYLKSWQSSQPNSPMSSLWIHMYVLYKVTWNFIMFVFATECPPKRSFLPNTAGKSLILFSLRLNLSSSWNWNKTRYLLLLLCTTK